MTQEVLTQEAFKQMNLALETMEAAGKRIDELKAENKALKEALAKEKTLQALHSENERLGLYKDAYAQPEQEPVAWMYQEYRDDDQFGWRDEIQFVQPPNDPNYFKNIVPVYATPPQRPEICCQQYDTCLKPCTPRGRHLAQRTWVDLTDDDFYGQTELQVMAMKYAAAKLKEKNT